MSSARPVVARPLVARPLRPVRRAARAATLLVAVATAAALGRPAALGAQGTAPAASAAAPTEARPFTVRVVGRGHPLLLVPGLMSGGDVWDGTVAHLADRYELHVVTLAGFAGVPAVPTTDFLGRARDALLTYARSLDHPVVVGHSLGGALAYAMAAAAPDALGGVVAVDGVPWLVALGDTTATVAAVRPQADAMRAMFAGLAPAQLGAQTRMSLAGLMRDTTNVARGVRWAETSDPATVGQAMAELMTTDLRPRVAAIRIPVLQIAAVGGFPTPELRATARARYAAQLRAVPQAEVAVAERAYHFVMLDDPTFFHGTLDAFLARVAPARTARRGAR